MNLGQRFEEVAAAYAAKTAVICEDRALTYQELEQRSRRMAGWFLASGVQPGDRIAIRGLNRIELVVGLLACWRAGAAAVPVNVRLKRPEVDHVLNDSGAVLYFDEDGRTLPEDGESHNLPDPSPDLPALLLYTSGTTARPKGVVHTHATLLATLDIMRTMWNGVNNVVMIATPIMHASGLTCQLLPTLLQGGTVVLLPVFDAARALDAMQRHRTTSMLMLPAMGQMLVREQRAQPRDLSAGDLYWAGGDAVSESLQTEFSEVFGKPLHEGYGMTELLPITLNPLGAARPGSFGKPVNGVRVRIVDLEGRDVVDGQTGEVIAKSAAGFIGYWNDPDATARTLENGWIHTGDLARRDADGYLWFCGRLKELIVRGGSNISPQEVEAALYEHPAVFEAGVVGVPDELWGETVGAAVVLRDGMHVTEQALIAFVRERLADYKAPERIEFLDALPKGLSGKVQRRDIKKMLIRQESLTAAG